MIEIYTDGSCLRNPGPGGWAAIIMDGVDTKRISGGDPRTTNNRMELMAAIQGLAALPPGSPVAIHSDSEYLVKTMTLNWKRNKNNDLWDKLDLLSGERQVTWEWVRAHVGHPYNEEADRLAVTAMRGYVGGGAARGPTPGKAEAPQAQPEPAALSHVDAEGKARMVDVSAKPDTARDAVAVGTVTMRPETLDLILQGKVPKGDVFTVARIAGVNAAKHTWELIPLAHQIPLSHVTVDFETDPPSGTVTITAAARTMAKTGVEMEALTAVSLAALTIYDMCKAVDRGMRVSGVRLVEKHGGVHGDYEAR